MSGEHMDERLPRSITPGLWLAALLIGAGALFGLARVQDDAVTAAAGDVSFSRDVRPILVKSCLHCHGFDPSTREADLRLDTFEGATAHRGWSVAAVIPGKPDESLLISLVESDDPHERMPAEGEPLSDHEIQTLRDWIAAGASYETHWSLTPLTYTEPPAVADPAWRENSIDAFIRARLDAAQLTPAPRADKRTLLRRAYFDLTGLPPAPDDVAAFEADDAPDAFNRLVKRLLASPRFGERWGRHWLDLARYAETYGHEFDYPIRHAWQYRDYVIRAINEDVPYDRFVTEHIAGDLLTNPRRHPVDNYNESIIATGLWWLSQGTHGPVDVRQDESDRIDNQIDVLSKTFLAATVSCARCHDHKFDPIYTREYYALAGFFQSSRRQDAYLDPQNRIADAVAALTTLDADARKHLAEAAPDRNNRAEHIAEYLLAAADVLTGEPNPDETAPIDRTVVFESFDDLTWDRWTVEGDAFTDRPTRAGTEALAGDGTAKGDGFANTHRRLEGEGSVDADRRVGSITSRPFVIQHDYLHALVGGGAHQGKTGLRIRVEGEVVHDVTGFNSLRLRPHTLDLRPHRGRRAVIEIYDQVTGGWGNIRVDEITLSDDPSFDRPARRSIHAVATEADIDEPTLRNLVSLLQNTNDASHPLAPFLAAIGVEIDAPAPADIQRTLLENFDSLDAWNLTGWAFGDRALQPGDWINPAANPRRADVSCAHSGALSDVLMGTARSETFEIEQPYIAIRARGRGVTRVIIDGYTLDEHNALLFNRCRLEIDSPDWTWHVHDVRKYVGHRAHFEIIDDHADASIAVDEIAFIPEDRAPLPATWFHAIAADTPADIAAHYQQAVIDDTPLGLALEAALLNADVWRTDDSLTDLRTQFAQTEAACPKPMRVTAMEDGTGEDEVVFIRGNHKTPGEIATRSFIGVFCDDPTLDIPSGSGRLELAERLLDDSNPLPARVMVNRVWRHLFGRGLVETTDDFGLLGAEPTHPELLDHLAERFRTEMNWSVKTLIAEIMASRTYQMASGAQSERALEIDPLNHLLSVRTPRRLEGEAIRDAVLQVSGRLDETMYGPSVPIHLSRFMTGRGRPGASGPLDGDGRRSIYLEVRRNFLSPMMATFDAPNPHSTIGKRSTSNVPAQSLILLNSPFIVEQSGLLADHLLTLDADARLDVLFQRALARPPSDDERAASLEFLQAQAESLGDDPWLDSRDAWRDLAHVVFNMKEFIFIE